MDILNPKDLRQQARTALRRGREPKKLIYSYAGITLAISVVVFLANLWLNQQIKGTGGLGNLGTRAIFETVSQVLPIGSSFITMCLNLGFLGGMMRICREQYADQTDLKTGFRKFWPLIRLSLLEALLLFGIGFLAAQVSSTIVMFTPWAEPMMEALAPIYETDILAIEEAQMGDLLAAMAPMLIIMGVLMLVMMIPLLFRLRMSHFFLLDDPKGKALAAIRESNRIMKGRFVKMLKVDLSLWVYHAATVLMTLVLYSDMVLTLLGIPFPMEAKVFSTVIFLVSMVMQFGIQLFLQPQAQATYMKAYDALREKKQDNTVVLGNIFDM